MPVFRIGEKIYENSMFLHLLEFPHIDTQCSALVPSARWNVNFVVWDIRATYLAEILLEIHLHHCVYSPFKSCKLDVSYVLYVVDAAKLEYSHIIWKYATGRDRL